MPQLIESIKNLIFSEEFRTGHKKNNRDFLRDRILPFPDLIFFLLNMNNKSYQDELDRYFQVVRHEEVAERILYKGNLSKARAKLKFEAFVGLNDHLVNFYYDHFPFESWYGMTLLAIDGTTLRIPHEPEIPDHFGVWHSTMGEKPCPKARASQMFDVLNKITVDALIKPKSFGERELAAFHFLKLNPTDLVLLDRGYPAHWLFKLVISMGANFCSRMPYSRFREAKKFYLSGKKEAIVKVKPSPNSLCKCFEMGLDKKPVSVRMIRIDLESGETEILATSLTDMKAFPRGMFKELYHLRWPIEEDYKILKYRIEIENFSGKSVHSVYQDFHAKVFSKNFSAVIAGTTKEAIQKKSQALKFVHQINFTQALSRMKNTIVLLFKRTTEEVRVLIEKLQTIFIQTTEAVRPDRKFPRRPRVKQRRFFNEYKTTA